VEKYGIARQATVDIMAHAQCMVNSKGRNTDTRSLHIIYIYRVSQEEGTKLREGVPYVKLYRKTPKHPYPKLNGLGYNGQ
jgi:hypothetical protein